MSASPRLKVVAALAAFVTGTTSPSIAQPKSKAPATPDPFQDQRLRRAAEVAFSPLAATTQPTQLSDSPEEPVRLARAVAAEAVAGKSFDVVVIGGTGSGVLCAVRAARQGLTVLLVQHNDHLGGMMANGLMQWDALYGGPRSPLFSELLRNIENHYIRTTGRDSADHQVVRYTHEHYPVGWSEPKVAEREFNRLVAGESKISLLLSHYVQEVSREGSAIRRLVLRQYSGPKTIEVSGKVFVDATYEGDLLAAAKAPFRVGREARSEFNEPHAGKVFTKIDGTRAPLDAIEARLNIRPYNMRQGPVDPSSPFTGDGAVQAYNYRFCVTRDPANRIMLTAPPPGYNREEYVNYDRKSIATIGGPRLKAHMNSPILPGENHGYPEGSWEEREKITERHKNFALGLIWFLQNDESVAESARKRFREWGLPKDEFPDHDHIPYEMYVREARRLVGRYIMTEHDFVTASGLGRTVIMPDSIATTDWYMDSHSCTTESRPDYKYDGKLILTEESRPAQIPYRSLLAKEIDNLLVPVCLASTHVAWGVIRLEPVWMQTGEAAGWAAALSLQRGLPPGKLPGEELVRTLAEQQNLITFFNDLRVDVAEPWAKAAQYLGTKGYFHDYDVRPEAPLKPATAKLWAGALDKLAGASFDATAFARSIAAAEKESAEAISRDEFQRLFSQAAPSGTESVTRRDALTALWTQLSSKER